MGSLIKKQATPWVPAQEITALAVGDVRDLQTDGPASTFSTFRSATPLRPGDDHEVLSGSDGHRGLGPSRSRARSGPAWRYFPARRCQRVALSIFLCFFFLMRFRRFFISEPTDGHTTADRPRA